MAGLLAAHEAHGHLGPLRDGRRGRHAGVELLDDVDLGGDALRAEGGEAGRVDVGVDAGGAAALLARWHWHGHGDGAPGVLAAAEVGGRRRISTAMILLHDAIARCELFAVMLAYLTNGFGQAAPQGVG